MGARGPLPDPHLAIPRHRTTCDQPRWALIEARQTGWRQARTEAGVGGRVAEHDLREIPNAILYVNRTGIAWRCMPTTSRCGAAALAAATVWVLLSRSQGAMRAVAADRETARLMGIAPLRTGLVALVIAAVLAGIGGIVLAPIQPPDATAGVPLGSKASPRPCWAG